MLGGAESWLPRPSASAYESYIKPYNIIKKTHRIPIFDTENYSHSMPQRIIKLPKNISFLLSSLLKCLMIYDLLVLFTIVSRLEGNARKKNMYTKPRLIII